MITWDAQSELTNLTHFDGRNAQKLTLLRPIFSELAWMKMRLGIMISYQQKIIHASGTQKVTARDQKILQSITDLFTVKEAVKVKSMERKVNHDLKALELYFVASLKRRGLFRLIPYVNLGIGSEDINNIALALQLNSGRGEVLIPLIKHIATLLMQLANNEKDTVMIARTHAQPANVTTFGKVVASTLLRLCDEAEIFQHVVLDVKCSGEVGTFQAQYAANQHIDWIAVTDSFIHSFGLKYTHAATQIAPYDAIVRYLQSMQRINSILLDFVKNMWLYILLGYLKVKKISTEVGSAGMPHKVNPIYFEGAEGGFTMANGIMETLARTLLINRLDRDFSDSTVRRNIIIPIALSVLSYQSVIEALKRIEVDRECIVKDLSSHQEIWIETIKTYAVTHGMPGVFELLKRKTRGMVLNKQDLVSLIDTLRLTKTQKTECLSLCGTYLNPYPRTIVKEAVERAKKLFSI